MRALSNATNERTLVTCLLDDLPCGNSVGLLSMGDKTLATHSFATACLGSFVFDWAMRQRIAGTNINQFFLLEASIPRRSSVCAPILTRIVTSLCLPSARYAHLWLEARGIIPRVHWALTLHDRLRLRCALDAVIAALYGLSRADLRWILRECDHPRSRLADKAFCRALDSKGFWRVDKDKDPELRHSILTLIAFDALAALIAEAGGDRDRGIAAFSALNGDEGWMLPGSLRLADYDLGHDDRARERQPVASRLGPRLLDWQLIQSPEQSWAECERHARAILGDDEHERRFGSLSARTGDMLRRT